MQLAELEPLLPAMYLAMLNPLRWEQYPVHIKDRMLRGAVLQYMYEERTVLQQV